MIHEAIVQDYNENLYDSLCPPSIVFKQIIVAHARNDRHMPNDFNNTKKFNHLSCHIDDHSHLLLFPWDKDVPGVRRILTVHIRNGSYIKSFIEKRGRAAGWKMVGHETFQRTFIQRGKFNKDGNYEYTG